MSDFTEIAFWVIAASAVVFIVPGLFALARAFQGPKIPPLPDLPPWLPSQPSGE